jgi:hypothetical protein
MEKKPPLYETVEMSWEEAQKAAESRDWSDMIGKSPREILSSFANTDRCIGKFEYINAGKDHACEIIAALDAAGFRICAKMSTQDGEE